ncbi:MAG TPA: helix-turn-helix transcriptional regulator [Bacteroidales bacterium]|nr:helix-turn-helix transcriptional regulator [Bacteroidales bacterium]
MISSELLKGSLRTIILKVLKEEGPMHGYMLTQKVEQISGGKIKLSYGALYPVLHQLTKEKALVTETEIRNNRMRIYYSLTPEGHTMVEQKIKELMEFIESLQLIINTKPGMSHA